MNTSLKHIVNNLSTKGVLKYTLKYLIEITDLIIREGVYLHSYLNFYEKFTAKSCRQTHFFTIFLTKNISVVKMFGML